MAVTAVKGTPLLRATTTAYRRGYLPRRGYGQLFDRTPTSWWGGDVVVARTEVGPLALAVRDHACRGLLVFGHLPHEVDETTLVRALAPRLHAAIDIGANVGWYSALMSRTHPECRVLAVEPDPAARSLLVDNVGSSPHVTVHPVAVGETDGEATLFRSPSTNLSSTERAVGTGVAVARTSLDSLTRRAGLTSSVDFVKCDVEGGEMAVLRGARELRTSSRPVWLLEADEGFLLEVGESFDGLQGEIDAIGPPTRLYAVTSPHRWQEIEHVRELRGTGRVNVLLVPEPRHDLVADLLRGVEGD